MSGAAVVFIVSCTEFTIIRVYIIRLGAEGSLGCVNIIHSYPTLAQNDFVCHK